MWQGGRGAHVCVHLTISPVSIQVLLGCFVHLYVFSEQRIYSKPYGSALVDSLCNKNSAPSFDY
jgi:hypothetical protein